MKRLLFFILLAISINYSYSQIYVNPINSIINEQSKIVDTVIICYSQPSVSNDSLKLYKFSDLALFLIDNDVYVLDICYDDQIILIQTNAMGKDECQILDEIHKKFSGLCYINTDVDSYYLNTCELKFYKK